MGGDLLAWACASLRHIRILYDLEEMMRCNVVASPRPSGDGFQQCSLVYMEDTSNYQNIMEAKQHRSIFSGDFYIEVGLDIKKASALAPREGDTFSPCMDLRD